MQLRTVKKPTNKAYDFGSSRNGEQLPVRKNSINKDQSEKDAAGSSNEVILFLIKEFEYDSGK